MRLYFGCTKVIKWLSFWLMKAITHRFIILVKGKAKQTLKR